MTTIPTYSDMQTVAGTTVTVKGSEFTLTEWQERAAQTLANGGMVSMPRRSGKTVIRERARQIILERNGEVPTAKSKTDYVWVVTCSEQHEDTVTLGVRRTKSAAKQLAQEHWLTMNDTDTSSTDLFQLEWANDKKWAETPMVTHSGTGRGRFTFEVREYLLPKTN